MKAVSHSPGTQASGGGLWSWGPWQLPFGEAAAIHQTCSPTQVPSLLTSGDSVLSLVSGDDPDLWSLSLDSRPPLPALSLSPATPGPAGSSLHSARSPPGAELSYMNNLPLGGLMFILGPFPCPLSLLSFLHLQQPYPFLMCCFKPVAG